MILRSVLLGATTVAVCLATMTGLAGRLSAQSAVPPGSSAPAASDSVEAAQALVESSCQRCHNDRTSRGNLSLATFEVATADTNPEVSERMIRKLRAGMMPPPGGRRPEETALQHLAESLESRIDAGAIADPVPGRRTFQRLNRAEYERSIHDLLELAIDAGQYLPPDTKSANFDNIADAQLLSTTLMNGYLTAASEISRLAVGDRHATASEATYRVTRWASQRDHVEGAPYGTRGGIVVDHTFAADGDYVFRVSFHHETTGALYGSGRAALHTAEAPEQIEVSVDGERLALLDIDRWMHASDPDGVNIWTKPFHVTAGPHRVTAAFLRSFEGPLQDLISPHDWSLASTSIADAYGFTSLPHLRDLAIRGPSGPTSVSETPSRAAIFTCRPATPADEPACARAIISRLGARAYRRSLTSADVDALVAVYDAGRVDDFESGIRLALEGILASPHFVFRFEEPPAGVAPTSAFHVSGVDLASRLSFFLWSNAPVADAAMGQDIETLRSLITAGANVDGAQGDGMTGLHWAAKHGDVEAARMLLDAGAEPDARTRIGGHTPLHVAAAQGQADVAGALLTAGAQADAWTTTGATSLHFAAASGSGDAVDRLIAHGADANARERQWQQTPLMFAAAANRVDAVRALMKAGADHRIAASVVDIAARNGEDWADSRRRRERVAEIRQALVFGPGLRPGRGIRIVRKPARTRARGSSDRNAPAVTES